ncbi:MAG: nucleotidyltransferase domain-containing protein [Candidatus Aenigmarchaeota archaeon]|nr:nucleotidyltransferase domain-containing protein [Candidatus Aenigmarchaeota archaeon]
MFEEALEEIKNSFESRKFVQAVVLFGSAARGEATRESDIDLFVVLSDNSKTAEKYVSDTILGIEKRHRVTIQCITADKKFDNVNRQFLDTLLREGVVICGALPEIPFQKLELEPYSLIKYDISNLSQPEKMKVRLLLFGKETKKMYKGKTYVSRKKGLVEEYGGIRTGIASILIPHHYSKRVGNELRKFGAKIRILPAWLQKV